MSVTKTQQVNLAIRLIQMCCSANAKFHRLPESAQQDIQHEVLVNVYTRKIVESLLFNCRYISVVIKFELKRRRSKDPYVEKERRKFEERGRRGSVSSQEIRTTIRSPEQSPLEYLVCQEEQADKESKWKRVFEEIQYLSPSKQAVLAKYRARKKLSNSERNIKFRTVKELRTKLKQV